MSDDIITYLLKTYFNSKRKLTKGFENDDEKDGLNRNVSLLDEAIQGLALLH